MKIKKEGLTNRGEKYSSHEHRFLADLNTRMGNYFWKCTDILSCKMKKIAKMYEESISKEYEKESKIFDLSSAKSILHIGCGAYPITAMTLAKINGAKITVIDKNPEIIKLAENVIQEKNLCKRITIEQGDGTNYPVEEFDTIIISGCAFPKQQILEHVFQNAKSGSKTIFRISGLSSKSIIDSINLHQDVTLIEKIENHPLSFAKPFRWKSFYFIKK
jgi:precorrin-6B methylase 2